MIFPDNVKQTIQRLSIRYIKSKKLLNIMAIMSVVLTSVLFTNVFTILRSIERSFQEKIFEEVGSRDSGTYDYLSFDEVLEIQSHSMIKSSSFTVAVGESIDETLSRKFVTTLIYFSEEHIAKTGIELIGGRMPEDEREIVTSINVLSELNIEPKIGEKVVINYESLGEKRKFEFVLSGYYSTYSIQNQELILMSEEFLVNQNILETQKSCTLYVNFSNNFNLYDKFIKVLEEKGMMERYDNNAGLQIRINPAYSNLKLMDYSTMAVILIFIIIIMIAAYLIIYNIFQISIHADLHFYGLLKSIGATSKQIRKIVVDQAIYVSIIGIPVGLLAGYILATQFLPVIGSVINVTLVITFDIVIFILSGIFTLFTVLISVLSPSKFAGRISPIEIVKSSRIESNVKCLPRKSFDKLSLGRLAKIHCTGNKKQLVLLILSLSLTPIIFNSILTFTGSFNHDKYMKRFVSCDFVAGNYKYFTYQYENKNSQIEDDFIDYISNQKGILENSIIYFHNTSGRMYYGEEDDFERIDEKIFTTKYNHIEYDVGLYGMDYFPLLSYEIINGELDEIKLRTGDYIIEVVEVDDFNEAEMSSARFQVGDKIPLSFDGEIVKEYEVIAQVKQVAAFGSRQGTLDFIATLILPTEEYIDIVSEPKKMNYVFNVTDETLSNMDTALKNYMDNIDSDMGYESSIYYEDQFASTKRAFILPGTFLSIMIGVIGILNFINILVTSIISRKYELEIMNKIGMERRQMQKMLIMEGVMYVFCSSIIFVIVGVVFNETAMKYLINSIWFTEYVRNISAFGIIIPFYIICAILVPIVTMKIIKIGEQ